MSARAAYLRASAYYALALSAVDGTKDPSSLVLPTFQAHRRCFDSYVADLDRPAEQVEIRYEGMTMPGYLFRPETSARRRPTFILLQRERRTDHRPVADARAGAVARGYNAITFDGPGQQSMLIELNVPFRHDWEHVISPVVDFLLGRPDVDPDRIAVYGISQGGYWAPRALAFEHRIAAGIADPGVYDAFKRRPPAAAPPIPRRRRQAAVRPGVRDGHATGQFPRAPEPRLAREALRQGLRVRHLR